MKHIIFTLCLILLALNAFAYVAPTTLNQPILVESSSSFYGSDKGLVTIDLNLTGKDISVKDFFVRIKGLEDANVWVKELLFNKEKTETISYLSSVQSKTKLSLDGLQKVPMQIVLQFDPKKLGFGKEFTVILETKDGTLVADLDPFLSGYNYRQQWCLNTDGISLSGNVTNDHAIYFPKGTDSQFWGAIQADGDDIRFTDSSNNLYNFHFEDFNYTANTFNAWVGVTETFSSSADTCGYMYYGNASATSGQNENATYGSGYTAVYHMDGVDDSTANNLDLTATGTPATITGSNCVIGRCQSFSSTGNYYKTGNLGGITTWSIVFFFNSAGNSSGVHIFDGVDSTSQPSLEGTDTNYRHYTNNQNIGGTGTVSTNTNYAVTMTSNGSSGASTFYFNSALGGNFTTSATDALGANWIATVKDAGSRYFQGRIDEMKILNYVVSADEVKILYNSEKSNLVTFSPYEVSNANPDINVTSPTADLNWNGTKAITFNVIDLDATNTLDVNLFYSSTSCAQTNLIFHDANLADGTGITCSDYNFQDSTACTYSWDTTTASDGLYYLDANVSDGTATDLNSSPRFRVDNTKPVTSFSGCTSDWHNTTQTITLTCADTSGSGCNGTTYRIDGGTTTTYSGTFDIATDGNHSIDYNSIDYATNVEITKTSYCAVDKTPPTVADPLFVGFVIFGNFINGTGTILGGLATDILSGIDQATCEYTLNGGGAWLSAVWNTDHCEATGVAIVNGTDYNISTRVDDNAGNTGTSDYNGTFKGDTTAPTTTDNASTAWSNANETITLTCADPAGAGCKNTFYCVDTAGTCTPTTIGTSVSVTCASGSNCLQYVRYFSQDNVDNNETVKQSVQTKIDKNAPQTTFSGCTAGWKKTDQTITLTCADTSGSGCNGTTYRVDGGATTTYSGTFDIDSDGNHSIDYNSIDLATNVEVTKTSYCAIDKTAPTYASIDGNGILQTLPFNVNVNGVNFNLSGKATAQYRIDAGAWTNFTTDYNVPITVDGNYSIDFNFTDNAGNSLVITGIDANLATVPLAPPTITVIQPNGIEVYTLLVDTPIIILTLQDTDTNELYVDVNYSDTNAIGTGTQILFNENVLTSPSLICDSGNFATDTNCSYSWNISSVPDGNYFIVVAVSDGLLDSNDASDAYFTIQPSPPVPVSTDYVERYIAPNSKQRDSNVYFNATSAFALTEAEKQTQALQSTESNIFLFGIIIIIILAVIAWFIWKRK